MFPPSSGIFYIATGPKHLSEAVKNARLTKLYNPDISVSICTDQDIGEFSTTFDHIISHPEPRHSYRDKLSALTLSPYTYTIFLDSDAFCCYSLDDIFSSLSFFNLAAVPAPVRHPPGYRDESVPSFFTELNTGVLYYSNDIFIDNLFLDWISLYDEWKMLYDQDWDQASFRSALWQRINHPSLRYLSLPTEYNLRTTKPWIAGRGLPVYFIHGRFDDAELDDFIYYLNHDIDRFRTYSLWLKQNPSSTIKPRFDRTFS